MKLKFFVFCPDDEKIISNIINAASEAIKKVHPYEKLEVDFERLEEIG